MVNGRFDFSAIETATLDNYVDKKDKKKRSGPKRKTRFINDFLHLMKNIRSRIIRSSRISAKFVPHSKQTSKNFYYSKPNFTYTSAKTIK